MEKNLYPLKFKPIFKEKIWGGRNLETLLERRLPQDKKIGESWEICDRGEDQSIVENGPFKGKTLHQLISFFGQKLLGNHFQPPFNRFPLLFKIIDAQEDLSLQVHPNDSYAKAHEKNDSGKTEMWHVIHAEKDAKIYCGLKKGIDKTSFKTTINQNKIEDEVKVYYANTADTFFIPAGTVHALGKGNVVIEIQQNSDLTYRLSDWGRIGLDGKLRPLHIEKSLDVIQFQPSKETSLSGKVTRSTLGVECPYFRVKEEAHQKPFSESIGNEAFQVWIILEGKGSIAGQPFKKGDFMLIPAHIGKVAVELELPLQMLRVLPGNHGE
ncbi:MAG: class I mannose-6-phosphate isomerase [Chlamydiae bacterium]|nr:class I mannose-6-phosphate isomerase [Chlamydiota bacterium]MBI3276764.1 class I mannose-6-phosphate isomerase [Chlamydiota bacterium]